MTISELLQYCMAKPGAEQSVHSDWKATQIKVEDVLFAMVKEVEGRPAASLKPARNWQSCYVSSTAMYDRVGTLIKRTGARSIWTDRCRIHNSIIWSMPLINRR
ncbi:Protein yjbR [Salmonella enterica]|nr:Protein yjbR [Salmonella enterica]